MTSALRMTAVETQGRLAVATRSAERARSTPPGALAAIVLASSMLVAAVPAALAQAPGKPAAPAKPQAPGGGHKVVVLLPADDPRLARSVVERAAPGHPQGKIVDALRIALTEALGELAGAGTRVDLQVAEVADAAAARQAAANSAPSTRPVPSRRTVWSHATREVRSLMRPSSTAVSTPWL